MKYILTAQNPIYNVTEDKKWFVEKDARSIEGTRKEYDVEEFKKRKEKYVTALDIALTNTPFGRGPHYPDKDFDEEKMKQGNPYWTFPEHIDTIVSGIVALEKKDLHAFKKHLTLEEYMYLEAVWRASHEELTPLVKKKIFVSSYNAIAVGTWAYPGDKLGDSMQSFIDGLHEREENPQDMSKYMIENVASVKSFIGAQNTLNPVTEDTPIYVDTVNYDCEE